MAIDAQTDWYTWSEFCDAARAMMPMENQRMGLQDDGDIEGFLTRHIRLAVIELQHKIIAYRKNHETIYYPQDFVTEGYASRAALPPHAKLTDFNLINNQEDDAGNFRYPVTLLPYSRRYEMINGVVLLPDQHGRIAIDEAAATLYVYPVVSDGWVFSVHWDGIGVGNVKLSFKADEQVPFEEDCAACVANFVKAHIAREVDTNLAGFKSYYESYLTTRTELYLRHKDKVSFQ